MPGLLDRFTKALNSPQTAMAAGLLSPTPQGSFGGGLLQGLQAGNAQQKALMEQQEFEQKRKLAEMLMSVRGKISAIDEQTVMELIRAGDVQGANAMIGAINARPDTDGGAFGGTGAGQFYNKYIEILPKIANGTATQRERLEFEAAQRELTKPQMAGSPETGFFPVPNQQPLPELMPLPVTPDTPIGEPKTLPFTPDTPPARMLELARDNPGVYMNPVRSLTDSERKNLIDNEGNHPDKGATLADVMAEDSPFKTMTSAEQERIFAGKSAEGIINQLEELSGLGTEKSIFKKFGGFGERMSLSASNLGDYFGGQNTGLNVYHDSREGFLSMIVRALGEKGTLATADIARIRKAIPVAVPSIGLEGINLPDTPEAAEKKFGELRRIIREINNRPTPEGGASQGVKPRSLEELKRRYPPNGR